MGGEKLRLKLNSAQLGLEAWAELGKNLLMLTAAPKNLGVDSFAEPIGIFGGPLAAILDFSDGAELQAVSECPRSRKAVFIKLQIMRHKKDLASTFIVSYDMECDFGLYLACQFFSLKMGIPKNLSEFCKKN